MARIMTVISYIMCTGFALTVFFIVYVFFMMIYGFDGREYSKSDFFDYYMLTPSVLMSTPDISDNPVYYTQGDDNYGFTLSKMTWKKVEEVSIAKKKLEEYMKENNIPKDSRDHASTTYVIEIDGDEMSLSILDYTG